LTSRLSLLRVYLFELLSRSRGTRLAIQTTRNRRRVSAQIGTPRMAGKAAAKENSSQITTAAIVRIRMVLSRALGRIHGLPVQSAEADCSVELVDKQKPIKT
jgi:hypothetical protein